MNKNIPRTIHLILVALFVAMPIGWVSDIQAQTQPGGAPGAPGAGRTMEIEGKIKAVDPSGSKVLLEDGTQLTIPPTVNVPKAMLKEGATVKASFEEKGGQNVVTSIEVKGP